MPNHKANVAVEVLDVTKRFLSGDIYIEVLKGVDLEALKGEILMIIGPSGSGKTTLLSVIAGTLRFDSGDVIIFNTSLKKLNEQEATAFRKNHIGFVFQQYHLIYSLNVIENISIPLIINGIDRKQALNKAVEMLEKVGMKGKEYSKPPHLSGGEQQRVAIARALIHDPPLLICDEPTASLDSENGMRVMKLIRDVAKSPDRCVIVVTHDPRIYSFSDKIVRMEDGLNIGYGLDKNHDI